MVLLATPSMQFILAVYIAFLKLQRLRFKQL